MSINNYGMDKILDVIEMCLDRLIMAVPLQDYCEELVRMIGSIPGIRHVVIFKKYNADSIIICHEWTLSGLKPLMDNLAFRDIPLRELIRPEWDELLYMNDYLCLDPKDIPGRIGQFLLSEGWERIMIIPVILERELMGFVLTDGYIPEREWIKMLRITAKFVCMGVKLWKVSGYLEQESYLMEMLMENIPDNIYFKDLDSRFIRINRSLASYFGLKDPSEAIGKTDFDFFTEEHARQAYEDEQKVIRTGKPMIGKEEKETWPDGRITWVSTTKVPLRDKEGRIIGTFGISRDITDRKKTEEELKASLEKYSVLFSSSPLLLARVDRDGRFWDVNPAMAQSIGLPVDSIVGRRIIDIFPEKVAKERIARILKALDEWKVQYFEDERAGKSFYNIIVPVRIPGEGEFVQVIAQDITERKGIERKYKNIFEKALVGIFQIAPYGWFIEANPALAGILGYRSPEELISSVSDIREQLFPDPTHYDELLRLAREREAVRGIKCLMRKKDGDEVWVSVNIRAVKDEEGEVIYYEGTMEEADLRNGEEHSSLRSSRDR